MKITKKFKMIFLPIYGALTILFILLSSFVDNHYMKYITSTIIVMWAPIIVILFASMQLQTIAGNYYNFFKYKDREKAKSYTSYYSTDKILESEIYKELFTKEWHPKIRSANYYRNAPAETRGYKIKLIDGTAYIFYFIKATPENTTHTSNIWVVNDIEFIEKSADII